jgi:hypothetical protein
MIENLQRLGEVMEATSVWVPTSVKDEPETTLVQWRVYKVAGKDGPTIHFNGRASWEGRVSSPVLEYDKETKRGRTGSGRVYELSGPSGYNGDAQYVWGRWQGICGNPEVEDITKEYE